MAQPTLSEIFEECVQRLAAGESLERCLARYPAHADRLRPMLETVIALRKLPVPQAEVMQDQAIVWNTLQRRMRAERPRHLARTHSMLRLYAALFTLILVMSATWFVLTRPDLPSDPIQIDPLTATRTPTPSPSPTVTPSLTVTPTASTTPTPSATRTLTVTPMTPTGTPSPTASATPTASPSATPTLTPSATFAPGCGVPMTAAGAVGRVLEIYPNTTITSVMQMQRFGDRLVWEVRTAHGIVVTLDVGCGNVLTIERAGADAAPTSSGGSPNTNSPDGGTNPDSSGGASNINDNREDNDNRDDNDNSGSGGSGGNDNQDDDDN
jgi:hypothetical protein